MQSGYLRWYDLRKGYGYIRQESGQTNLLITRKALTDSGIRDIRVGQRINYEILANATGQESASNISLNKL